MSVQSVTPLAINWESGLESTWASVAGFVPKLLIFLVVLFIAWIVAKAVAKALEVVLDRIGFTKVLDKAGADDVLRNAQISPVTLISKLAYYFILLIGLQLALSAFGPTNPVSQIVNEIVAWLPRAFVAVVIVVIAAAVANAVKDLMRASLGGLSYGPFLARMVGIFIISLGVIAALNQVGIGLSVTMPVLVAVLATVGGILVVGVGGGLILPMRARWEGWLNSFEDETRRGRMTSGTGSTSSTGTATGMPSSTSTGATYSSPSTTSAGYQGDPLSPRTERP